MMADPFTLAAVSIGSSVVGAGVSAYGASVESKGKQDALVADSQAAAYRAAVARNNQTIAAQNAEYSKEAGTTEVEAADRTSAALQAKQKVTQAASGVDVNSGTPIAVRQSSAELAELDRMTIMHNALLKSRGFDIEGMNYGAEAELQTSASASSLRARDTEETAGTVRVASSLIGGASSVSNRWLGYQQRGTFS